MFTEEQKKELSAPLDRKHVRARTQAGRSLSYVEGWHVIAEANRIFGFDAWAREVVRLEETNRDLLTLNGGRGEYQQWRVGYLAVVRVTVGDVVRQGTGFGSGMAKPEALGEAIESAVKEAETDAMKRAFMTFGNPFGLALYDKDQANVCRGEPEPPKADATPFDDSEKDKLAKAYVDKCVEIIGKATDADKLISWWDNEADNRATRQLTHDEVDGLKTMALRRIKTLKAKEPA